MRGVALLVLSALALASGLSVRDRAAPATVVEPRMVHVDRSPPISRPGRAQLGSPAAAGRKIADIPQPSRVVGGGKTDESVTFGVNTRGELGPSRAKLMCKCDVLSILVDENEENERRSYTGPELRAKVPMVTADYAKDPKHKQISFGVNVRNEEGPEFNPTWCNCEVQGAAHPDGASGGPAGRGAPGRVPPAEEDDDEDEELESAPASPHGAPAPQRLVREHIQLEEGSAAAATTEKAPAVQHRLPTVEVVGSATPPTAAQLAESTVNLQTESGLTAAPVATTTRRRHSWTTGSNVMPHVHHVEHADQLAAPEYSYHGHRYSADGVRLDKPKPVASAPDADMVLTELAEGTNDENDDTAAPAALVPSVQIDNASTPEGDNSTGADTAAAAAGDEQPEEEEEEAARQEDSDSDKDGESVVPQPESADADGKADLSSHPAEEPAKADAVVNHTLSADADPVVVDSTNVTAAEAPAAHEEEPPHEDSEDSEADDALTVIQKLRTKHPHTSEVLARALAAAATQQDVELQAFKKEMADKDEIIKKLIASQEKEREQYQADLKQHEDYEKELLATASPSPTPSASAPPSESSTPSASPSPSPSASMVIPVEHFAPKINRKACYDHCKTSNCQQLFDRSLQQYTDCMESCAEQCYE